MQTKDSLKTYQIMEKGEAEACLDLAVDLVRENLKTFTHCFPDSNSRNNFYPKSDNREWTTGFWTGEIWLAYERTGEAAFREAGTIQAESFLKRIRERVDVDNHDMGFLYTPSCVAAYRLTGNETAREAALLAADNLMGRFQEKGQFFQAWGQLGARDNYRLIIDCLLNMPLLFWASETTGDKRYREKAEAHIRTAMNCVIRPDHSTYHTYFFDPETGAPVKGVTHQGNRDGSAWSRGQAWGIYGSALSYRIEKNAAYMDVFRKVTDYFLAHLPSDLIPYWDFDFDDGSGEPRDSSSAAIAACGMLEMAKFMEAEEAAYYRDMAGRLVKALSARCAVRRPDESNGLLLHGTYARASAGNPCADRGVDECNTWGDYFYMEALTRLVTDWEPYWY
ncbi:glycoside hydrolase family 88 protein [Enterocloster asparagiformis]|uniref:glycoside hydrolase family 88 protein n=1 Tax=Enterocloster asparagiformis TaxID=333367 RepID=UPI002356AC5E